MTKLKVSALLSIGLAAPAVAVEIEPAVELGIIRTDNLTLADANPEDATIWQLTPSIRVTQNSPRTTADVIYQIEGYDYRERNESEVVHQLDADFSLAFMPERFFLDLDASRTQAILDPNAALPINNFVVTANRVDRDEVGAGPSFDIPVGDNVMLRGQVRRAWVNYADPLSTGLEDEYHYDNGDISVDNFRRRAGFSWAVRHEKERVEYEQTLLPYEYQRAGAELGFWAGASRVFVAGGKESPWDEPLDSSLDDTFWEIGFDRAVEEGLTTELGLGERTYGSSRRGRFAYATARSAFELSYAETPMTNAGDRFVRGGMFNPDEPLDYLFRAGSVSRYISKRFAGSLSIDLQRTEVALNLFDESREQGTLIDGTPIPDETQDGGSLTITWSVGQRLEIGLGGVKAYRDVAGVGSTNFLSGLTTAEYELGQRTRLTATYQSWKERSDTVDGPSYRARLISASVERTFR